MSVVTGGLSYIREVASSPEECQAMVQIVAVTLFVCGFLSSLCFVGAASTLHVKLFAQRDDDRRQFARLRRLGVARRELRLLVLGEVALLFLTPVAVAVLHSAVAIGEVTLHLIPDSAPAAISGTWLAFSAVVLAYLAIFATYGGALWLHYQRQVVQR